MRPRTPGRRGAKGRFDLIAALLGAWLFACVGLLGSGCGVRGCSGSGATSAPSVSGRVAEAVPREVQESCVACHRLPSPSILPRAAWDEVIPDMAAIMRKRGQAFPDETERRVLRWYRERAPERLPLRAGPRAPRALPVRFEEVELAPPKAPPVPGIAHVRIAQVVGDRRPELIACDMRHGLVFLGQPWRDRTLRVIAKLPHPAHAEPCDLDGDGRIDLVVADLGSIEPADHRRGQVVWLRNTARGFEPVVLAGGLGRVADVRPADLDGDGDLDLVVAAFGWRETGALWLFECTGGGRDGASPRYRRRLLDPRHGAVGCEVADVTGDGRAEIVAFFAQEHEALVLFKPVGDGRLAFRAEELWRAPHPAWGSTGLEVVDLDGDGDRDVLFTNGDLLDDHRLKPDHGVRWLEQQGGGRWNVHVLAPLYGAYHAVAADFDGDGDLDVVACSLLPHFFEDVRGPLHLPSVLFLEQRSPRTFELEVLEWLQCDHATLDVGDLDGDARPDLVVGGFSAYPPDVHPVHAWVRWYRNLGVR